MLIGRWTWTATLQKARGKGWGVSWVCEDCFENSSGLLLVVDAPTTSKRKGTWCQQSTSITHNSLWVFSSRLSPPLLRWDHFGFPGGGGNTGANAQSYSWTRGWSVLPAGGEIWIHSKLAGLNRLFIKKSLFWQSGVCGLRRSNQKVLLPPIAEVQEVTLWINLFNLAVLFRTMTTNCSGGTAESALVISVLLSTGAILIPL